MVKRVFNWMPAFAGMTSLVVTLFILLPISQSQAESINASFKKITQAQPFTFFCQLPISPQGKIKVQSCGYCPIEQVSMVAMPIVPNEILAKNRPCYQHKICAKPNGPFYQGLSCCKKIDSLYQQMAQDLHNWVPETRQVKQLRGQHTPSVLPGISPSMSCQALTIDKKNHFIHIPEAQRGIVARIYLYMADTYQLKLEQDLRATLESWHILYGVTAWEKNRNRLIYNEQGTYNRRVEELAYDRKAQ